MGDPNFDDTGLRNALALVNAEPSTFRRSLTNRYALYNFNHSVHINVRYYSNNITTLRCDFGSRFKEYIFSLKLKAERYEEIADLISRRDIFMSDDCMSRQADQVRDVSSPQGNISCIAFSHHT